MESLALIAAVSAYAVAGALSAAWLGGLAAGAARAARVACGIAFLAQLYVIGARGVAHVHPVSSVGDAIGFAGWLIAGAYLIALVVRRAHRLDAVGAVVAPLAAVALVTTRIAGAAAPGREADFGLLGRVHISLAALGVGLLALATAVAVVYLAEDRQLKRRRVGHLVRRGIALETLDALAHRLVLVGFPVFTLALLSGAAWLHRLGQGMRVEYPLALIAWGLFGVLLLARTTAGWRGRRAALLTLGGFASAALAVGLYVMRGTGA